MNSFTVPQLLSGRSPSKTATGARTPRGTRSPRVRSPGNQAQRASIEERVGLAQVSGRYHRLPRTLQQDYDVTTTVLGSGVNGAVRLAISKNQHHPSHKFAVKEFSFAGISARAQSQLESEAEVFLCMDHPNIARLVDVYESDVHLDLVMECIEGGDLFDKLKERKQFPERDVALVAWQMLLALNYVHCHGIMHGDVKLENWIYDDVGKHVKLIDFGFSKWCDRPGSRILGTTGYVAPEALVSISTSQADMWGLGVIVFILLSGYMPFSGSDAEVFDKIRAGAYKLKPEKWSNISEGAKAFMEELLVVDHKKRLTAQAALEHNFIASSHWESEPEVDFSIVKALSDFGHQPRFRRCCMSIMAWSLTNEERAKVEEQFLAMDQNHHGQITYGELKKVMVDRFHMPDKEAKLTFQALDMHHDQEIHFSDFLAAMVSTRIEIHEELMQEAFRRFDEDGTGYITSTNLKKVIGDEFEGQKVEKMLCEADILKNGRISYHEFVSYVQGRPLHLHGDEPTIIDEDLVTRSWPNSAMAHMLSNKSPGLFLQQWSRMPSYKATGNGVVLKGTSNGDHGSHQALCVLQ